MKRIIFNSLLIMVLSLTACSNETKSYSKGIYLLLDTSGTYTRELEKANEIIKYFLSQLEAGDTFAVARIDSGSFSEKDIIAKATFDARPSVSNNQKREFSRAVESFIKTVKSSAYTDISGGMLQGIEYLNESMSGEKTIFIFSDLKEELPKGYVRDVRFDLNGYTVVAINATKLRSDNINPAEYMDRLSHWQNLVQSSGGEWSVINDLDREDALML